MISKVSISVAMQASYYKCVVCMHLEGERICEALAASTSSHFIFTFVYIYKTFIASLLAFQVVAKGSHTVVVTAELVIVCIVYNSVLCVVWRRTVVFAFHGHAVCNTFRGY